MKIAILHTAMDTIGGAEKLVLMLAQELNADIFTTNINNELITKMGFSTNNIFSIGKIPTNQPFRNQIALFRFRHYKFPKYDSYIIAGDWAISAAKTIPNAIWYVHSPFRELFDLYSYTKKYIVSFGYRTFFKFWATYNRFLIRKYSQKSKTIICNSKNTQNRVKLYLNRNAIIVHPPISHIPKIIKNNEKSYWLSVNRLITHKRVEMQLDAFRNLPNERLIIVGSYENATHFQKYAKKIQKLKPNNVKILSWVDETELQKLYSECKGFITTAKDEDFGMTVVEAMAHGKTIIAPNEGGYKETIINNKTGYLIDDIDVKKLSSQIKTFKPLNKINCQKQAKKFIIQKFAQKILKQIKLHETKIKQ